MRRASGPQNGSNYYVKKDISNKTKSPNHNKAKSKGKLVQQHVNSSVLPTRKNNSYSKIQPNQSSTFFTTQLNKSKKESIGKKAKSFKKAEQKIIMQLLHQKASIIQRQWRKYLIRKYRSSLQEKNKKILTKNKQIQQPDSVSVVTSRNSQAYNSQKYCSFQQEQKRKVNDNPFKRNQLSYNLSESKGTQDLKNNKSIQKYSAKNSGHNRARSDQQFLSFLNNKTKELQSTKQIKQKQRKQIKNLQMVSSIVNLNVVVENPLPQKIQKKKTKTKIKNADQCEYIKKYEDHYVKNQKSVFDQIIRKLESKLEQKKLKKILALQNSFSNNLMTFRSYKKNKQDLAQEHIKKLNILQNHKKKLLDNFNQLLDICQKNGQQLTEPKIKQKQNSMALIYKDSQQKQLSRLMPVESNQLDLSFHNQSSVINSRSIVFDDWDFDAQFSDYKPKIDVNKSKNDKNDQIFIQDSQKQSTIINQLNQDHIISSHHSIEKQKQKQSLIVANPQINKATQIIFKVEATTQQISQIKQINNNLQTRIQKIQVIQYQKQQIKKQSSKTQIITRKQKFISPTKQQKEQKSNQNRKRYTQLQVEQQLKKFFPIQANIDIINNWLLEISHFILDNFVGEFLRKLINIEQPSSYQMIKHCKTGQSIGKQYLIISQKVFKQFQFFHIKTLITDNEVPEDKKQTYSALMFTFHQALYDCLNRMLMDELLQGRNWINYPWTRQFKIKKLVGPDHSKQSLQKAINRVSNISDYNILPTDSAQISKDFQQTQHNLIFAQQVKEIPIECQIARGHLIYQISQQIELQIWKQQIKLLFEFKKQ